MDVIVLSKFLDGCFKVLLVPELSASHQPGGRLRIQVSIPTIILRLHTSSWHALEEGKEKEDVGVSHNCIHLPTLAITLPNTYPSMTWASTAQ